MFYYNFVKEHTYGRIVGVEPTLSDLSTDVHRYTNLRLGKEGTWCEPFSCLYEVIGAYETKVKNYPIYIQIISYRIFHVNTLHKKDRVINPYPFKLNLFCGEKSYKTLLLPRGCLAVTSTELPSR